MEQTKKQKASVKKKRTEFFFFNSLDWLNGMRHMTEESTNEIKERKIENTQFEQQPKNGRNLRNL